MIYCVEDDANIRELVAYTLQTMGFEAKEIEDGKALKKALAVVNCFPSSRQSKK